MNITWSSFIEFNFYKRCLAKAVIGKDISVITRVDYYNFVFFLDRLPTKCSLLFTVKCRKLIHSKIYKKKKIKKRCRGLKPHHVSELSSFQLHSFPSGFACLWPSPLRPPNFLLFLLILSTCSLSDTASLFTQGMSIRSIYSLGWLRKDFSYKPCGVGLKKTKTTWHSNRGKFTITYRH